MTRVLFASAEFVPIVSVGGLGAAAAGLVRELRNQGAEVEVVVPDYNAVELDDERRRHLTVPEWVGPAQVRSGSHPVAGPVHLVEVPGIRRSHPYTDAQGTGWADNDRRFFAASMAIAALASELHPDVVHLNDWHTAAALAATDPTTPAVLSIHNLAYQGETGAAWLAHLGARGGAFERAGACNPLAGGIRLADAIIVVSPHYRDEILLPQHACGLLDILRDRADALVGIRNGIDTTAWDPAADTHLARRYQRPNGAAKSANRAAIRDALSLPHAEGALVVGVTRLAEQKGIDLLLPIVDYLPTMPAQLAVLGAGDAALAHALRAEAQRLPANVAFVEGYDEVLARRLLVGGDLLVMPSRFEPCGLTQMQAMRYATLPVATDVGGLHDTIVDLDQDPAHGTGWLAPSPDPLALLDALHRAVRGWRVPSVRRAAQRRGMSADWSWQAPAAAHLELYERISSKNSVR